MEYSRETIDNLLVINYTVIVNNLTCKGGSMAYSNNDKQKRHKQLERLRHLGNEVLFQLLLSGNVALRGNGKTNEEIKAEVEGIVSLPRDWTQEDYDRAQRKLENLCNEVYDNPHILHNDIHAARSIMDPKFSIDELRRAEAKAKEAARSIKAILNLAELTKSDQIAVVAEVLRQFARELLDEKATPKTFANAMAFSLIGSQYEKPEWTCNLLARNLCSQNSPEFIDRLVAELHNPDTRKGEIVFNE